MSVMTHRLYPAALIGLVLVVGACSDDGREMKLPTDNQNESIMTTTLAPDDQGSFDTAAPDTDLDDHGSETELFTSWSDGSDIPIEHTCLGLDQSPPLNWTAPPVGTVSLAIILIDTSNTTQNPAGFVHWVLANIDPSVTSLFAGETPVGTVVGANDFSTPEVPSIGYRGPCPPAGETHTYVLEMHALDQMLDAQSGDPAQTLLQAIDYATIVTAKTSGIVTG